MIQLNDVYAKAVELGATKLAYSYYDLKRTDKLAIHFFNDKNLEVLNFHYDFLEMKGFDSFNNVYPNGREWSVYNLDSLSKMVEFDTTVKYT